MKKLTVVLLIVVCALYCAFVFAACDIDLPHTSHNWSTTYTQDGNEHYQTCSDCDEKKYTKHNYGAEGVCICGKTSPETVIDVTEISLNKDTLTLEIGGTADLTVNVKPDNATDKNITWKSDNTDIVMVANDGKVTAVSAGAATVTATAHNGKAASRTVTVNAAVTNALAGKTFVCYDVICRSDFYGEDAVKDSENRSKDYNVGSTLAFNNDGTFMWSIKTSSRSGTYIADGETVTLIYSSPAGYEVPALYRDGEVTMEIEAMKIITCYYLRLQNS